MFRSARFSWPAAVQAAARYGRGLLCAEQRQREMERDVATDDGAVCCYTDRKGMAGHWSSVKWRRGSLSE